MMLFMEHLGDFGNDVKAWNIVMGSEKQRQCRAECQQLLARA